MESKYFLRRKVWAGRCLPVFLVGVPGGPSPDALPVVHMNNISFRRFHMGFVYGLN